MGTEQGTEQHLADETTTETPAQDESQDISVTDNEADRPEVVERSTLQESDEWCRSVGKDVLGIHYRERNGTGHAVCKPGSDYCALHYDKYNAHDRPVTHLVKDAPEVLAVAGLAVVLGPGTAKKALKWLW